MCREVYHGSLLDLMFCCMQSKTNSGGVISIAETTKGTVKSGLEKLEELTTLLSETKQERVDESFILRHSFDPFMYRTLVGNAPVRKVAFRKPAESISILSTILSEIGWAACDLLLCEPSLGQVRRMLNRFSKMSINILSRSLMVLNLYFDGKFLGQHDLKHFIAADMKQISGAPDDLLSGKYGEALLTQMAKPIYDTLKLFLLNRNRQQAYLDAAMIPDWASIQQEARAVDLNYCMENQLPTTSPPFFSHYLLYNILWLMDHYIALGLELNLFHGHHDLSVAYWYRDVLLSSLLNTLGAMKQTKFIAQQKQEQETKSKVKKKGGKGKKNLNPTPTNEDLDEDFDLMLITLKRVLCRGLARVSTVFILTDYHIEIRTYASILATIVVVYCISSSGRTSFTRII